MLAEYIEYVQDYIFDRQMQTKYLVGNLLKNIVKVGGDTGVDNAQMYDTGNLFRLLVGGTHIQTSDVGAPCWSSQKPNVLSSDQRITSAAMTTVTYISLCSYN